MNIFNSPQEKGSREWKSIGSVLREKHTDLYPTGKQRTVRLSVREGKPYHQQFFILKNARG